MRHFISSINPHMYTSTIPYGTFHFDAQRLFLQLDWLNCLCGCFLNCSAGKKVFRIYGILNSKDVIGQHPKASLWRKHFHWLTGIPVSNMRAPPIETLLIG